MPDTKRVYLNYILYPYNLAPFDFLKNLAAQYGSLTIGIPSDYVMARLYGEGRNGYTAAAVRDFWKEFKFIDDIVILDDRNFGYQEMWERLKFDVCFFGSEYGRRFEADKKFMAERGVDFVSLAPDAADLSRPIDAMTFALKNLPKEKKLVLFGTGKYFDLFIKKYSSQHSIAYAVDSDSSRWNSEKSGVEIMPPQALKDEKTKDCLVVLCAKNFASVKESFCALGDFDYRTLLFSNSISLMEEMNLAIMAEDEYLKEAHRINVLMTAEFDRVCRKYRIPYYMICGSLIGVVRHHGLIPWDDDVDVAVTRDGFERLKEAAKTEWAEGDFSFVDCDDYGPFYDFMPRLVYNKERLPIKAFDKLGDKAAVDIKGKMFVDVYIFEEAGKNPKRHYRAVKLMQAIYTMCMGHRAILNFEDYARLPKQKQRLLKFMTKVGSFIPLKVLIAWYEKARRFAKKENSDYYFSANLSIMCIDRRIKKSLFGDGKEMQMENLKVMVPQDYDGFLESMNYHGYMNFPPLSIRKPSHYFNSDIEIW